MCTMSSKVKEGRPIWSFRNPGKRWKTTVWVLTEQRARSYVVPLCMKDDKKISVGRYLKWLLQQ
ncbi:hypothetical protein Tco_0691832, partial [Tanacetum coccineum]